jgi:hypothetical protein
VKFGQMLSLRPDVVGDDVAEELGKLQGTVAPDPPGIAQALVERELGAAVSDRFGSFDPEPMAAGSVAQVHRATLPDGTVVAVKVLHDGVEHRVLADLELMEAIAAYLENQDPGIAQLRPTVIVSEFSQMLHDAIDLSQELQNLQRFTVNFADEPDVVVPRPYPELSRRRVLTMSLISGAPFADHASVEATGWDVDALVRRAAEIYLEMIFRDSLYHADPQPGNLLPSPLRFLRSRALASRSNRAQMASLSEAWGTMAAAGLATRRDGGTGSVFRAPVPSPSGPEGGVRNVGNGTPPATSRRGDRYCVCDRVDRLQAVRVGIEHEGRTRRWHHYDALEPGADRRRHVDVEPRREQLLVRLERNEHPLLLGPERHGSARRRHDAQPERTHAGAGAVECDRAGLSQHVRHPVRRHAVVLGCE